MKRWMIAAAMLVPGGLALAGCNSSDEESTSTIRTPDGEVTVSDHNGTMSITTDDGNAVIKAGDGSKSGVKLPDGLTLYPGAKVIMTMNSGDKGGLTVMETPDGPDKVDAFYRKQIDALGLAVHTEGTMAGSRVIGAKDDASGQAVNVVIKDTGDGTQIHLTYARDG